jgi:KUP system potassium uptake protein
MRLLHTSEKQTGQIYIPTVNWLQYSAIVLAVGLFQSSSALASAYGIAVTATMVITTLMAFIVVRYRWRFPLWVSLGATLFFLTIELVFFSANILKVVQGGWFTLMIAAAVFTVMTTWSRGRMLLRERLREESIPLEDFLRSIEANPPLRVPGTAVFLSADAHVTPNALLHNLKHNMVLHEQNLFVTVQHHEIPWVDDEQRFEVTPLGPKCWQIIMHFGFKNEPDVPKGLQLLEQHGVQLDPMTTSYFLSRDIVIPTIGSGMAPWREKLFANMHRNASAVADFLNLPANRVVELGSKVEI